MLSVDDSVSEQLVMFEAGLSPSFETIITREPLQLEMRLNYVLFGDDLRCFLKYRFRSDQAEYTYGLVFESVDDVLAFTTLVKLSDQRPLTEVTEKLEQLVDRLTTVLCVKTTGSRSWQLVKCLEPEDLGFPVYGLSDGRLVSVRSKDRKLLKSCVSVLIASDAAAGCRPVGLTPDGRIQYKTVQQESKAAFVCQKCIHHFDLTAVDMKPQFFQCQRTEKWSSTSSSARFFRH